MSSPTNPAINITMTSKEWTLLLSLGVIWGGSFFFIGVLVDTLPPLTIVLSRVALAALALHLFLLARGTPIPLKAALWKSFFVMGLINNVAPFSLIVWGQGHIASGLASILNATTPMFAVIVAHFLTTDERLSAARVFGVLSGFAGVAVLIGGEALDGLGTDVWAQIAILGAALSYSFAGVYGRRFRAMGIKPLHTAAGQVTASSLVLLPITLWFDQPWTLPWPDLGAWGAVLGLALVSTALGYFLYFRILSTAGATNVLLVTILAPLSAIVLGAMFLGERLGTESYAGMVLIALGLAAIDGRLLRRLRTA